MSILRGILAPLFLSILVTALPAQGRQPPPDCKGAEHRQFDFWAGEWVVLSGTDTAGTNSVTLEESGCIVHEHWTGSKGGTGQSFNFYDRTDGKWHQIWIDSNGMVLRLSGSYADGKLSYTGATLRRNGTRVLHRLGFTGNADGTVRQLWESSTDEGKSWSVVFDGVYVRKK
jgi:hypothetical protein